MFVVTNTSGLTSAIFTNAAGLPRTTQTAPVANSTPSIPTTSASRIQSARLTHRPSDNDVNSIPVESSMPDSEDSQGLDMLVQKTLATAAELSPVLPSTELNAELLDIAFLDFDLSAL